MRTIIGMGLLAACGFAAVSQPAVQADFVALGEVASSALSSIEARVQDAPVSPTDLPTPRVGERTVVNDLHGTEIKQAEEVRAAEAAAASRRGATSFRFSMTNPGGSPARWNPCAPIHYVVDLDQAPAGALADVQAAIAKLSARTGLRFVYDGRHDVKLTDSRLDWVERDGTGANAPLVIGWGTRANSDILANAEEGVSAVADTAYVQGSNGMMIVASVLVINASQNSMWSAGYGPGMRRASLLLHELGHVAGLTHVDDASQLMYFEVGSDIHDYAAGDRNGLARLGRGGCLS